MKSFVFSIIFVLSILIACSAQAQLTVYDDFSGKFVDTARWSYNHTWGDDVRTFEGGFRILKGKLSFFSRAYGGDQSNTALQNTRRHFILRDVGGINSIETSIQIAKNGHEITGCTANPEPSETRIFMGGAFFNNGTSTGPTDFAGDIMAFIGFFKYSDLGTLPPGNIAIPPGYMGVRARVLRCTNTACSTYDTIYETLFNDLLVKLGKKTILRITLDKNANTFTFQVGKKDSATYPYAWTDSAPPVMTNTRLEVAHWLANCTSSKAVGWADILVDYVSID
jgi:hypothetical protein